MANKKMTYEEVRGALRDYLPIFLEEEGIAHSKADSNGRINFFKSIYSETEDKKPSLHIIYGDKSKDGHTRYHDFSTGRTGDIFTANNILNGKPLIGYEFLVENLKPLAERYGLDFEMRPMTPEEIEEMNIRQVYNMIKEVVTFNLRYGDVDPEVMNYIKERGYDRKEDTLHYSLGYVPNWKDFEAELIQRGISKEYLKEIDVVDYKFNSNNLIFCVSDAYGNTRGFGFRNCYFGKNDNQGVKYYNTENNRVYNKAKIIYNLNHALKRKAGKYSSLYITEGYTDGIAMDKAGLKAGALCGTAFSNDHISLLQKVGETDIVLILDGDDAGMNSTAKAITEVMEGIRSFRTRIVTLPDGMDPEEFLRSKGSDALLDLPHISAFKWRLHHLRQQTDFDPYELAKEVIPLVVNETSELEKDKMCKQIAEICDLPLETVRKEVANIAESDKIAMQVERDAIIDNMVKEIRKNPDEARFILSDTIDTIDKASERLNANIYDESEYLLELDNIKFMGENASDEDKINLFRMPRFEEKMGGETAGRLAFLGGEPNAGKTAFLINYAINALLADRGHDHWGQKDSPERANNVSVIFHTVDGGREEVIPKFVAVLASEYHKEVTINHMYAPNKYRIRQKESLLEARNAAWAKLKQWGREGRLIIKDSSAGATLNTVQQLIRNVKRKHPDRHVIFIGDNFYNYTDFANFEDEKKRIGERANVLKSQILEPERAFGFFTVEYKKGGAEGGKLRSGQNLNEMIKETKTLEYRANWIGHLLNDLHSNPDTTEMFFWDPNIPIDKRTNENRSPIVTLAVGKNKITEFKGQLHYYFLANRALHLEITKKDFSNMTPGVQEKLKRYYFAANEMPGDTPGESGLEIATGRGADNELPNIAA